MKHTPSLLQRMLQSTSVYLSSDQVRTNGLSSNRSRCEIESREILKNTDKQSIELYLGGGAEDMACNTFTVGKRLVQHDLATSHHTHTPKRTCLGVIQRCVMSLLPPGAF